MNDQTVVRAADYPEMEIFRVLLSIRGSMYWTGGMHYPFQLSNLLPLWKKVVTSILTRETPTSTHRQNSGLEGFPSGHAVFDVYHELRSWLDEGLICEDGDTGSLEFQSMVIVLEDVFNETYLVVDIPQSLKDWE